MPNMTFDFDGLIGLLARNLYSDKGVFIRELIQNAHDSILRRRAAEAHRNVGRIDITCSPKTMRMEVKDDGEGMGREELERYLSVVGSSGTRTRKGEVAGMIGQFGIGFLSAFLVAGRVEVRTRKPGESTGWLWSNEGTQEYRLEPLKVPEPGTTVTVLLRGPAECGQVEPDRVISLVRKYADLLDVPVFVDGDGPVNRGRMPWEGGDGDADCRAWIEDIFGETPMDVIPVDIASPRVTGLLYVSRTRLLESSGGSRLRIYCNRMYLRDEGERLLPEWAHFIGGIIDTPELTPTAARDNFQDDADAARVKTALADLVINHFLRLAEHDPTRLADIVSHHDFGIKAACRVSEALRPKVWDLLHWRVNDGEGLDDARRPLPAILDSLPAAADGRCHLPIFTQRDISNQYFAMANAVGMTVIDATRMLDEELLVRWARQAGNIVLVRVDQDDGAFFQRLAGGEGHQFQPLVEFARHLLAGHVNFPVEVEVRRVQPDDLPVIFRAAPASEAQAKGSAMLQDSGAPADMHTLARELLRLAPQQPSRLILNAANPLIGQLAAANFDRADVAHIMIALFEGALLGSQDILTASAASHFRSGFHRLLERHLVLAEATTGATAAPPARTWPQRRTVH